MVVTPLLLVLFGLVHAIRKLAYSVPRPLIGPLIASFSKTS